MIIFFGGPFRKCVGVLGLGGARSIFMACCHQLVSRCSQSVPASFSSCFIRGVCESAEKVGDSSRRLRLWCRSFSSWKGHTCGTLSAGWRTDGISGFSRCEIWRGWRVGVASGSLQRRGISACDVANAPVANDATYGGKEVVQVTDALYEYMLAHTREPEVLQELRGETSTYVGSHMQVSPEQAQLLAMLVQIMGAQRCIEVGVFTGYSSLAVALALPDSGRLVACERCEIHLLVAQRYYERAGVAHKVIVKRGIALETLQQLLDDGEAASYDFTFIDADKRNYPQYYELLLRLVRPGGLIVVDNVLWHGKVANPQVTDFKTQCIRNFNQQLMCDRRVAISMVPIGDGMTICRKL